ncbi:MAG: hypothetical protein ACFB4I_17745 [Cyanophyceae cyanobacterium]
MVNHNRTDYELVVMHLKQRGTGNTFSSLDLLSLLLNQVQLVSLCLRKRAFL